MTDRPFAFRIPAGLFKAMDAKANSPAYGVEQSEFVHKSYLKWIKAGKPETPENKTIPRGEGDVRISIRNPGANAKDLKKAIEWYLTCYCPQEEAKWPKMKPLAIPAGVMELSPLELKDGAILPAGAYIMEEEPEED